MLKPIFFVLDYDSFLFELVNQKTYEMTILKMAHLISLESCHLPLFKKKINLPHIYGHCFEKPMYDMIIIKLFTWFTNLFQSYGITMFSKYYKFCEYSKLFQ